MNMRRNVARINQFKLYSIISKKMPIENNWIKFFHSCDEVMTTTSSKSNTFWRSNICNKYFNWSSFVFHFICFIFKRWMTVNRDVENKLKWAKYSVFSDICRSAPKWNRKKIYFWLFVLIFMCRRRKFHFFSLVSALFMKHWLSDGRLFISAKRIKRMREIDSNSIRICKQMNWINECEFVIKVKIISCNCLFID